MSFYPETSMNFRSNTTPLYPDLNVVSAENSTSQPPFRSYLSHETLRPSPPEISSSRSFTGPISSPIRQQLSSLPSFLPSPSRFLQNLPASPASLLSPLIRRIDDDDNENGTGLSPSALNNPEYERYLADHIDNYFLRRRQYLQNNINLSMNMSRWVWEHIIFYSVETLRRQSQIHSESSRYYLTPLSAIRMIYTMKNQQGMGVLWKGCFSSLVLTSAETISNNLIEELAPLDEPSCRLKHLIFKSINSLLLIPLYSVHFLRSVQSDLTINNHWSPLTIFIEPFQRLFNMKSGFYARAFPLWYLISFSIPYFVSRHFIQYFLHRKISQIRQEHFDRSEQSMRTKENSFETVNDIECQLIETIPRLVNRSFICIEANLLAVFLSNILLYPYETILNRLFVQGTRTIVDDLDKTSLGCVAINTRYLGFFDCCRTIFETEGFRGFFKGIGFLMFKFGLIYAGVHCSKVLIERLAIVYTQNTSELSKFHHYVLSKQQETTQADIQQDSLTS